MDSGGHVNKTGVWSLVAVERLLNTPEVGRLPFQQGGERLKER